MKRTLSSLIALHFMIPLIFTISLITPSFLSSSKIFPEIEDFWKVDLATKALIVGDPDEDGKLVN